MSKSVPVQVQDPLLWQVEVVSYLNKLLENGQGSKLPDLFQFMITNLRGVAFACNFTCLCVISHEREFIRFFRVPPHQRDYFKNLVQKKDYESRKEFMQSVIRLMVHQLYKYHVMVAKVPIELYKDPNKRLSFVLSIKQNMNASYVFRGPRIEDNKFRIIIMISGEIEISDLIANVKKIEEEEREVFGAEHLGTDEDECCVCMSSNIEVVLTKCGHVVLCKGCANNVLEKGFASCPICSLAYTEEDVKDIIKV